MTRGIKQLNKACFKTTILSSSEKMQFSILIRLLKKIVQTIMVSHNIIGKMIRAKIYFLMARGNLKHFETESRHRSNQRVETIKKIVVVFSVNIAQFKL